MTEEELKEYAAANRSRLEKQKIVLGDVVKLLVGRFAGEMGVVKGIMVSGNDFADPYYEIEMECEVPDEYKCRKTLLTPNNVIGGLSAYEFEVIGNRAPDSEPTPKFKVGDKVKIVSTNNIALQDKVGIVAERPEGVISSDLVRVEIPSKSFTYLEPCQLAPYAEPTDAEDEDEVPNDMWSAAVEKGIKLSEEVLRKMLDEKVDMEKYRMELAKELAVAMITATQSIDVERVMDMTDGIVERLKDGGGEIKDV